MSLPRVPIVCQRAITLYVAASGSDGNPGLTSAFPLKTLVEAERRLPYLLEHDVLIDVIEAGTYVLPAFQRREYRCQVWVRATPATTIRASTAALAGSTSSLIKSSGLVTDQYVDYWVHVLTGAAAGDYRLIRNNTATDIIPVRDFSAAIGTGDTYEIVDALVQLTPDIQKNLFGPPHVAVPTLRFEPCLNFENFVFDGAPPVGVVCLGRVAFWRCVFGSVTGLGPASRSTSQMLLGIDRANGGVASVGAQRVYGGSMTSHVGAGIVSKFSQEPEGGGWYGYANTQHGLHIRNHTFTCIVGGNLRGDHFTVRGAGVVALVGLESVATPQIADGPAQNSGALRVWENGYCTLQRANIVAGSGDVGCGVERGGTLDILGVSGAVSIAGSTYGLHVRRGAGRVFLHEAAPTITGGTAKYAVGETPDTSNALATVGDALISADGNLIQRVE